MKPIAPSDFGGATTTGNEAWGWEEDGVPDTRRPFPLRMIAGVDLIGLPNPQDPEQKPRILIDEVLGGAPYDVASGKWAPFDEGVEMLSPSSQPDFWCMVRAASNATLKGFQIDGVPLDNTSISHWPAVYILHTLRFVIEDCDIGNFHDALCLATAAGERTTLRVDGSDLHDAWPLTDSGLTPLVNDTDYGHAALWVVGDGISNVQIIDTRLAVCHDAIEVDPRVTGAITLSVVGARFEDNENGLEIVGQGGTVTYALLDCVFLNQHNRPPPDGGTYHPGDLDPPPLPLPPNGSVAAIYERYQGTHTYGTVRRCEFFNSTFAIVNSLDSHLDLGTTSDPGLNNFCLDFSGWAPNTNPFRTQLFQRSQWPVDAVGNFWIRNNQFADADGIIVNVVTSPGENLPNIGQVEGPHDTQPNNGIGVGGSVGQPGPPGPLWDLEVPGQTGVPVLRNYSTSPGVGQFPPAGAINFESTPLSPPFPDCSVDP